MFTPQANLPKGNSIVFAPIALLCFIMAFDLERVYYCGPNISQLKTQYIDREITEILHVYKPDTYRRSSSSTQIVMNDDRCGCISVLLGYTMFF